MLEYLSIRRYSPGIFQAVTIRSVQTISRKPKGGDVLELRALFLVGILRDYTPSILSFKDDDIVRAAWRHAEAGRNDQPLVTCNVRDRRE